MYFPSPTGWRDRCNTCTNNVSSPHARERTLGRVDGKLVVNPSPDTFSPTAWNDGGGFDLLYAANEHRVLMIEMGGGPTGERLMDAALKLAHKHVSRGGALAGVVEGARSNTSSVAACTK